MFHEVPDRRGGVGMPRFRVAVALGFFSAGVMIPAGAGLGPVNAVSVGYDPFEIAVDSASGTVYVAVRGGGALAVVDAASETLTRSVAMPRRPVDVTVDATTGRVYVVSEVGEYPGYYVPGRLTVLDAGATILGGVDVGRQPAAVTVNASTRRAYVVNAKDRTMTVLDADTLAVVTTVPTGLEAYDVLADPATGRVYVAGRDAQYREFVVAYDGATYAEAARRSLCGAWRLALHPEAGRLYVTGFVCGLGALHVLDAATLARERSVDVGAYPFGVAVDQDRDLIWVSRTGWHFEDDFRGVVAIDAAGFAILDGGETGVWPFGLALNPATGVPYVVAGVGGGALYMIGDDDLAPAAAIQTPNLSIVEGEYYRGGSVAGVATDDRAGIRGVEVTFAPLQGTIGSPVRATIGCATPARRSCSWSATVPSFPGVYRVSARPADRAGNVGAESDSILIVVT